MADYRQNPEMAKLIRQLELLVTTQQQQAASLSKLQSHMQKIEQDIYQDIHQFVSQSIGELLPQTIEDRMGRNNASFDDEIVTAVQMDEAMQAVRATMRDLISEQIQLYLRHHNIPSFFT